MPMLHQMIKKGDSMGKFEKASYYLLSGYLIVVFLAASFLVKLTIRQAVSVFALPFLVWVILTVYYLVRWSVRRARSSSAKHRSQ